MNYFYIIVSGRRRTRSMKNNYAPPKIMTYFIILLFSVSLLSSIGHAATTYEIQPVVSKYVFGPNENVPVIGYLRNMSSNSTANVTVLANNSIVRLSVLNSANSTISNYSFTTNENGTFFSNSSFNPSAAAIKSPDATGTYTVLANYTAEGSDWTSRANIVVMNTRVDDILFQLQKINFYTSENMPITAKVVQRVGDSVITISNVSLNVTVRQINENIISSFVCTTSADGTCVINTTAPSSSGTYILEANNFVGFTNFNVVPFDVEVYMKDSSALVFKNIFTKGESGFVEVRVSYNSTTPTGIYNATGTVADVNDNAVLNLSSVILNSTNGFLDKIPFTAVSSIGVGFYTAKISVAKEGGNTVNATTTFQVRDWSLTFTKASQGSAFEYGYTAFVNTTVFFNIFPVERGNGTVIQNLTNNFTIVLKNNLGNILSNTSATYNASCSGKACYQFSITTPSVVGDYILSVALNYSNDYQTADRTIKATDITASAQPSDSEGTIKEVFGTTEFVYISLSGKNKTSAINITNAELANIIYENGTKLSYVQDNLSTMNLSDSALKWAFNASVSRLVIDPPKMGGTYLLEIYVNNKSAVVTTRIGINPFDVCTSAKGSADTSTSDYWYQFRTSDTIYFQLTINEAQNTAGKTLSGSNLSGYSSVYGRSSQCSFDTTKKRSANNATVTIEKVFNTQSGKTETLNSSSSTCAATDNNGGYLCTIKADDNLWDGGRYAVTFNVFGDDKQTQDKAGGSFEARAFYIYGYSNNWANKANSNITLTINAYEAGSGWWTNSNGLVGTASIDSINYYGGVGEWIWPPIKYEYNVSGLNMTITNGIGSITLPANRSTTRSWTGGYYSAVIKANVNNQVDYGEAWFSIRNWDAYATAVEIRNNTFDTKSSINSKQNATLYVRITEAGSYSDYGGGQPIGNLSISVKKIINYAQYPATELTSSNFTANTITVNASSPWYTNANPSTHGNYLINISPTAGSWDTGYYTVILNLNNTESGYGWFNVISFYINTQPTNANGSGYVYNNKGNGPVYFNVTTTKSQTASYTASDYVNATIIDVVVRLWDQTTQSQREFKYPTDINVTPLVVNGSGIINVTYRPGTWPSGYYYGEIKMQDNIENTTSKGWIWFSVQPFRVTSQTSSYNVGTKENVSVSITINEPDWSNNAVINGNYTIVSVQETSWNSGVYRIANLNYSYNNTGGVFRNSTTLTINPSNGKWSSGYKSGTIIVKDNNTNATQTSWFSFRATPFTDTTNRISNYNSGPNTNVTVNITLATSSGALTTGNLSSTFTWGWPSRTAYRFVIGGCDSLTSRTCFINGSAIVTIVPPSGGWQEGYNYIYFNYVEPDDGSSLVESYSNVYFYVRQTLTGYMNSVSQYGGWQNSFGQAENVTMYLYSLQNLTGNPIAVNVTSVQVAKTESNCWSDSCRVYQNVTFEVMNLSGSTMISAGRNTINATGYVRLNASGGSWNIGEYAVKVFVRDRSTGETGIIKDATFRVIDKAAPVVTITSPTAERVINASTILFTATTSEQANCYVYVYDYGQYDRSYCSSTNSTNSTNTTMPSACNTTKYNNATSYYFSYASKWASYAGTLVSTDSTAHSYNHSTSGMTSPQNYTVKFDCYDTDWNYATNATTFNLIGVASNVTNTTSGGNSTNITISISSPSNTTYATTNISLSLISLNFTISTSASSCWYKPDISATNTSLPNCANTTYYAPQGWNRVTVYANNSGGTVFNSSTVFFSVSNTTNATGTNLTITINFPANATYYGSLNITLEYNIIGTPSACWYRLNNGTNVTLSGCANQSITYAEGANNITVYANNTNGTIFSSATRYFTDGGFLVTISSPANTTYSATNVSLNFSVTDNAASACWYKLNSGTNVTLSSCGNSTFIAVSGLNNLTVYANRTTGTIFNSSTVYFTTDTIGPTITFVAPTANRTYVNANTTFINVTLSEAPSFIRLEFNGTNYTMTNSSATNLVWYRNQTNLTYGNYTFKVYANDTVGNMNVSSTEWVFINVTS